MKPYAKLLWIPTPEYSSTLNNGRYDVTADYNLGSSVALCSGGAYIVYVDLSQTREGESICLTLLVQLVRVDRYSISYMAGPTPMAGPVRYPLNAEAGVEERIAATSAALSAFRRNAVILEKAQEWAETIITQRGGKS